MKRQKKRSASSAVSPGEDTASRIVAAATRLFADKGYDGASTKEICEKAGANIAAVHYYFGSKSNLYRHIVEQFTAERMESARRILQPALNADDLKVRLEILLQQIVEALLNQPEVAVLVQRGLEMSDLSSEEVFKNTIAKLFENLVAFLAQAKKKGLLAGDVDPLFAAGFLRSQFLHQTRLDAVMKRLYGRSLKDEAYRTRWVRQTVRLFLGGVLSGEHGGRPSRPAGKESQS